jgi:hypothetical protein
MLGALPIGTLAAQDTASSGATSSDIATVPPSMETFYTRVRFTGDGGNRVDASGFGARFMWRTAALLGTSAGLPNHIDVGLYGSYLPRHALTSTIDASALHVGAAADVRAFATPLRGRLDPYASLGVGVLATRVSAGSHTAPAPLFDSSRDTFTFAPGVGTRVMITPNIGVQGDVRDLMTFNPDTRHNAAFTAGLYLHF